MVIVFAAANIEQGAESIALGSTHLRAFESRSCRKMHYGNHFYILQQMQYAMWGMWMALLRIGLSVSSVARKVRRAPHSIHASNVRINSGRSGTNWRQYDTTDNFFTKR